MHTNNRRFVIAVVGLNAFVFSAPVFAYLDPGSGSVLLQGILAALAAIGVTVKLYWHRLLRLLGLKRKSAQKGTEQAGSGNYHHEEADSSQKDDS
ncbi:hypothetical protein J2T55_001590 [Methylohalomonas lacus]|uniref:Uncharacterized protein n=1 Tax=Methylohalomonas lacus TaxID=398773 RepID=A0AAE3L168_9GAMM|nr:hypothetical protein [Methylohalomonas lacus]MCS3903564.1 hypothetical protein [Methylohalomonas lacus]